LLQATDRITSEVHTGHRVSRRHRELLWRRIDARKAHGLLRTVEKGLGRIGIDKQPQDVSDQRVHVVSPHTIFEDFRRATGVSIYTLWISRRPGIGA
jgi:hypothetical protein